MNLENYIHTLTVSASKKKIKWYKNLITKENIISCTNFILFFSLPISLINILEKSV